MPSLEPGREARNPTSSGVLGAKPVRAAIASTEAKVSSTSASGRGASRMIGRAPKLLFQKLDQRLDPFAAMIADIQHRAGNRRRRPVQAADHAGDDIVDIGEVAPQPPSVIDRDRLARPRSPGRSRNTPCRAGPTARRP